MKPNFISIIILLIIISTTIRAQKIILDKDNENTAFILFSQDKINYKNSQFEQPNDQTVYRQISTKSVSTISKIVTLRENPEIDYIETTGKTIINSDTPVRELKIITLDSKRKNYFIIELQDIFKRKPFDDFKNSEIVADEFKALYDEIIHKNEEHYKLKQEFFKKLDYYLKQLIISTISKTTLRYKNYSKRNNRFSTNNTR